MRLGLRGRMLGFSLGVIAICAVGGDALLGRIAERHQLARAEEDLLARAKLVGMLAAGVRDEPHSGEWPRLSREWSAGAGAQVTVLGPGGEAPGGQSPQAAEPSSEDQAGAALIREALVAGQAVAVIPAEGSKRLVAAVRVGEPARAVVRLSTSLEPVDASLSALRWLIAVTSGFAALLAWALSELATRWLSRTVSGLATAARQMAAGEAGVRARDATSGELGELGRAFDQLAESLLAALRGLRIERDLFRDVLEAMQEGVLVLDAKGGIEHVNSALREMLLLDANVQGRRPLEVIRNSDLQQLLRRAREQRGPVSAELEVSGLRPRRLLVRAVSLPGENRGLLASFVDLTTVRRLETLRRDFVANVSHELRTPVASILSAAETLRAAASTDPAAAARFLEMIERNTERMDRLVNDLLELARAESRELRLALEPVELGPAVELAAGMLRPRAGRRRVGLRIEVPPRLRVVADRRAIEQIVSNLLDNAIKYCPEGSQVTVLAVRQGGRVRIEVRDEGPGIAATHLPRIFERFYRVDAGRSREQGGTGLGLAIVKHLAEAMGGSLTVKSVVGRGSTFAVELPGEKG